MKRKEQTKTFMIISNWKTLWSPWFMQTYFSVVRLTLLMSNCQLVSLIHLKLLTHGLAVSNELKIAIFIFK